MAKKVLTLIKLQIPGGQANPAPPVGPALGQHGVNIMEFCKAFNAQTAHENGRITPVEITVFEDRSFTFITKTPPAAVLIKEALELEKGSAEPNRTKVGTPLAGAAAVDRRDEDARSERPRRRRRRCSSSPARPARWAWRWSVMADTRQALRERPRADRPRAALHAARGRPAAQGLRRREVRRDGRGALPPRPQRPPRRPAAPRHADAAARHRTGDARRRLRRGREGPARRRRPARTSSARPTSRRRSRAASRTSTSPSRRPT